LFLSIKIARLQHLLDIFMSRPFRLETNHDYIN
jgi:hypothetical protein